MDAQYKISRRTVLQAAGVTALAPISARAQTVSAGAFPSRQVRIVVPYTPGGTNDVMARAIAQKLQEMWPHPVIVENKPGAAGNIGASDVVRAEADGHTLLLTNININSMNPALIDRMPFDPQKDLAPISLLGTTALALVVHPSVPANNTQELIAYLKKRPGQLSYASSGNGSPQHLSAEMFKALTGTRVLHIPYRGAAPGVADVVAGQLEMTVGVVNQLIPHIRSGRLKAIGVTSKKRQPSLPDVPTLDESGVPGYESEIWLGLCAPAATPAPVIRQINAAVHKILTMPDVVTRLNGQGLEVLTSTPDQMRQRAADDLVRWTKIIKTAGIKAE
ncbi:Bug family tripartite tricarboxylate transporter substrate binding protein [Hydrogenophaga sp. PBL-H3]|uniref:Bug family tripartite tricarboxylate transporter substrate binding protein n=1 Tax=Hydrogenophaga sp. PBL-H3 TaxID=434010 RepID=UPI00131F4A43|nr:tripartite tricarboxylate transporter substrate binding protein [Hydrogenophaga sp. PBL-H3]QHE75540.1 tripartite tricarboxylate transporter substrate binding protein [Hydrogenophaga sp. PBL-H3]QHE79966.1 tripartite tricarboxylate transporter substrate binding protein [Hydrogenophaga sp. PBL-H3]